MLKENQETCSLKSSIYTYLVNTKHKANSKIIFELINHGQASITWQKEKNWELENPSKGVRKKQGKTTVAAHHHA